METMVTIDSKDTIEITLMLKLMFNTKDKTILLKNKNKTIYSHFHIALATILIFFQLHPLVVLLLSFLTYLILVL